MGPVLAANFKCLGRTLCNFFGSIPHYYQKYTRDEMTAGQTCSLSIHIYADYAYRFITSDRSFSQKTKVRTVCGPILKYSAPTP